MEKDAETRKSYGNTWEEISENTYPILLRYAIKLADGNEDDALDLLQEAFCRVVRYDIKPEIVVNPLKYMSRVLKNLWYDNLKKFRGIIMQSIDADDEDEERREALINNLPKVQPDVLRLLENEELQKALRLGMRNLEPLEKDVLRLFLEGKNCDEIAEQLNRDVYRIKYELNKVRAKVRYRLDRQTKAAKH